ncbi:hypothetical protein SESBI_36910 [Sesbania bispinosa]|nr:hypothetical protein SESBI_36910 [Sesbania bispinosa]
MAKLGGAWVFAESCSSALQRVKVSEAPVQLPDADVELPLDNDNAKNGDTVLNVEEVVAAIIEEQNEMQSAGEGETELDYNSNSDESLKEVHFDDSEEERDLGIEDGFDLRDVGQAEEELNEIVENMKNQSDGANTNTESPIDEGLKQSRRPSKGRRNTRGRSRNNDARDRPVEEMHMDPSVGEGSANVESFVPADVAAMHEIEEEYVSDELDSGVEDGSDDNGKPSQG